MAENFFDAKNIKKTRGTNFMGGAKEIREIPKVERLSIPKIKKEAPPAIPETEPESKPEQPEIKEEAKLVVKKGFIVGYTDEGNVLFKPFGEPSKLEIVGLVEYSKAIAKDLLDEMANTKVNILPAIKEGLTAALQATQSLLAKEDK